MSVSLNQQECYRCLLCGEDWIPMQPDPQLTDNNTCMGCYYLANMEPRVCNFYEIDGELYETDY